MAKRLTARQKQVRALTERKFQTGYVKALRDLGFRVAHHYDSRFSDEGTRGVPDLTVVGHRVFWMEEMKRVGGEVKPAQEGWSDDLALAGVEVRTSYPHDWDEMITRAEQIAGRPLSDEALRQFPV